MSLVTVSPELVAGAASDLARIGSSIGAANAAAAGPTTTVLSAAADEVSVAIATLFGTHAAEYQSLSTRMAAFHEQFVQTLTSGAGIYVSTETANASLISALQLAEQNALNAINAPTQSWLGRPLIGNGVDATPGSGQAGGAGGLLWGNGGAGGSGAAGWRWRRRRSGWNQRGGQRR